MAKNRFINTKFWDDDFIASLSAMRKLQFLYLLTNPMTNISGVYQTTERRIQFDTGLTPEEIQEGFKIFSDARKIWWFDGWVYIRNFQKHQQRNKKISIGIENSMAEVPENILAMIENVNKSGGPEVKPKEIMVPKIEEAPVEISEPTPKEKAVLLFEDQATQNKVVSNLVERGVPDDIARRELRKFISYWTESNGSGTKQRWQLEKVFEINKRLVTWFEKYKMFNSQFQKNPGGKVIKL